MKPAIKTPVEVFLEWEKKNPDRIYFVQPFAGKKITYTWKQAGDEIRRIAAYLHSLNLPRGSRIALVSKNCAHWIMTDLAIMMSGHISVPLYPNINAKTLRYVLEHSESKVLFVGKLDAWNEMKSGVPDGVHCISFPFYEEQGYKKWDEILKSTTPLEKYEPITLDEVMTIVYTSGTTGNPKGVVLKCRAVAYATTMAVAEIKLGEHPVFFSYLPMSHIAERMLISMGGVYKAGEIHFAESLDTFAKNLAEAQPTIFLAVPRIWTKFQMGILEKMPQKKLDLLLSIPLISSLVKKKIKKALGLNRTEFFLTGAAPIPASQIEWYQKLGIPIQEVYAMTENSAYSHFTRGDKIKPGYAGQPMPEVDVKISEIGEVLVKTEATMEGYYKEPELTAQAIRDGYLHTGDKGEIDAEGFLKITGRVKEIFKSEKGKYISPAPIEMNLSKDQHIEQVCVIGAGFPQPMALIVLSQDARNKPKEAVKESLSSTLNTLNPVLESHERLCRLVIVNEEWTVENAMLTPTMKIKRMMVEDKYSGKFQQWYSYKETVVWEG